MTAQRDTRPDIVEMPSGASLPRKSGELVFHDDWERQAFAIAVSLAERGVYQWSEFQQQLIAAIADAEREDPLHPSRGYYESWLVALEKLLAEKSVVASER